MLEFFAKIFVRFWVRKFGLLGVVVPAGVSMFLVMSGISIMGFVCTGCMGLSFGLVVADHATASTKSATVTGHHWERRVWPQEAHRDSNGKIVWRSGRPVEAEGDDLHPYWPEVPDDGCEDVGCRRPGSRDEKYHVKLKVSGRATQCFVSRDKWEKYEEGVTFDVKVGGVTGAAYCSGDPPKGSPKSKPTAPPKPDRKKRGRRKR